MARPILHCYIRLVKLVTGTASVAGADRFNKVVVNSQYTTELV